MVTLNFQLLASSKREPALILLVQFREYKTQEGGWIVSFQMLLNFRKQSASLFGLTVLDSTKNTIDENAEHNFYMENLEPHWG